MTWKRIREGLRGRLPLRWQWLLEVLCYWRRLCRYNASVGTAHDRAKMQYVLLRQTHVLEKGMSLPRPRRGWGRQKAGMLLEDLQRYAARWGGAGEAADFLSYPLAAVGEYIRWQQRDGVEVGDIEKQWNVLCRQVGTAVPHEAAGVQAVSAEEVRQDARGDFESLLMSRHSIRCFRQEQPPHHLLERSLALAQRTPSACNRQAWHTHVLWGEETHELLRMQDGCKGFGDEVPCCIVVTADMKGFLGHEPFQCYVDGGLYAQNLINALHYVGLGTIPISCGFLSHKLLQMQQRFGIPENEVMIVIVGVGMMEEQTRVAVSRRKPVSETNTYH